MVQFSGSTILQQKYEKGSKRKDSSEYHRVNYRRQRALKRSGGTMTPEIRALTKQMRSLPSMDTFDPGFVRVKYIRYADDWIVGVTGPKSLAEQIKDEIQTFLWDVLKLQLSQEKTVITHAKTEEAFFLGTRLQVGSVNSNPLVTHCHNEQRHYRRRCTGWSPLMRAPIKKLVERLHQKGFCDGEGVARSKTNWVCLEVKYIIELFNSTNWGLLNYYRFADNFASMSRIQYILHLSLAKTLAHKLRKPVKQLFCEHGRNLLFKLEGQRGEGPERLLQNQLRLDPEPDGVSDGTGATRPAGDARPIPDEAPPGPPMHYLRSDGRGADASRPSHPQGGRQTRRRVRLADATPEPEASARLPGVPP